MTRSTVAALVILAAPAWWYLLGAVLHGTAAGRRVPRLVRALAYDMVAVALALAVLGSVRTPAAAPLATPPAVAVVLGAVVGLGLHRAYGGPGLRELRRRWSGSARRAAVQGGVVTITSVAEEVAWRGVALTTAVLWWGWPAIPAVLLVGALFGALHVGLGGVRLAATHAVSGVVWGALLLVTGQLLAPVAAHAAYNLAVVAARQPAPGSSGAEWSAQPGDGSSLATSSR